MSPIMRSVVGLAVALALVGLATRVVGLAIGRELFSQALSDSVPSDAEMIRTFATHRSDFDLIARMSREDSTSVLSESRRLEYRTISKRIGLPGPIERSSGLSIQAAATGIMGGDIKGYLYSADPPTPLVQDLDQYRPSQDTGDYTIYRSIGGGWYIWYEWEQP